MHAAGINQCTQCVGWRRRDRGKSSQREGNALFDDFWYFSSRKSTIKEKYLYVSSLSEFFSLVRKERKGQKEECFPLLNTFRRLAATGANTLPRPSNHSLAAATGSKRSSANSDLLLCHVRLRRTSRLSFWQKFGCEHSEIGFILIVPSAQVPNPRPPRIYSGRAGLRARICSAFSCAMFARVVWFRLRRAQNRRLSLYPLSHTLATHGSRD